MATKKEELKEGYEYLTLPYAREGEDPNFYCGVNGVGYLIPKGETVQVPDFVAFEAKRAIKAIEEMNRNAAKMKAAAKQR